MSGKASPLTTWCCLLRLPNLFTVPGDPLAGFMLATGGLLDWRVAGAMATSLLLYSAGLLLNDYFDRAIDARERPNRPIPSGAVEPNKVFGVGLALIVAGIAVALAAGGAVAGLAALALALAVLAYDGWLKNIKGLGQIVMGGCRAGSVLVGAAFAADIRWRLPALLVAGCVAWAYTTSITFLAAGETSGKRPGWTAHVPGLILVAGGIAMLRYSDEYIRWPMITHRFWDGLLGGGTERFVECSGMAVAAMLALGIAEAELNALRVLRGRLPVPAFVGRLIRAMVTIQAAWCAWACRPLVGHDWQPLVLPGVAVAWALALLALGRVEAVVNASRLHRGHLPVPRLAGWAIRAMLSGVAALYAWGYWPLADQNGPRNALLGVALVWLVVRSCAAIASRRFYGS